MSVSLNGWPAIQSETDSKLQSIVIPGVGRSVTVAKKAAPLFAAYYADWHRLMPKRLKLDKGPIDGWEYREARAANGLSNHSSATAVDVRYDVLLADRQRHMTDKETAIVHELLDIYVDDNGRRVFGWGGDWDEGSYMDEMHTELAQGWSPGAQGRSTTPADVKAVMKRLGIKKDGTRPL